MEDKNKIGAFFNDQLSDHKEEVSLLELEMMSTRMSSYNFMKFHASTFNIYYAAAIFSGFLISLTLGTHYLSTYRQQENMLEETRKELALLKKEISAHTMSHHTSSPQKSLITVPSSPSRQPLPTTRKNNNLPQPASSLLIIKKRGTNTTSEPQQKTLSNKTNLYNGIVPTAPVPLHEHAHSPKTEPVPVSNPEENLGAKKKVIIYKRDTIYQYDTLKVKKRNQ